MDSAELPRRVGYPLTKLLQLLLEVEGSMSTPMPMSEDDRREVERRLWQIRKEMDAFLAELCARAGLARLGEMRFPPPIPVLQMPVVAGPSVAGATGGNGRPAALPTPQPPPRPPPPAPPPARRPAAPPPPLPEIHVPVTLDQIASSVRLSKDGMRKHIKEMPPPRRHGGKGRGFASLWEWSDVRPWLEQKFGMSLENHPLTRQYREPKE